MCLFWGLVDSEIASVCDLTRQNKAAAQRIRCKLFELAPSLTCDANIKTETLCLLFGARSLQASHFIHVDDAIKCINIYLTIQTHCVCDRCGYDL